VFRCLIYGWKGVVAVANSWLPTWLSVLLAAVFVGILVVHLWHLAAMAGRSRLWHGSHVLMSLGMIDMLWSGDAMVVSSSAGQIIFGVAAGGFALLTAAEAEPGAFPWLWLITALDLVAMVYMFAMMSSARHLVLTVLLVVWFAVEALGWVSGRLASLAQHEALVLEGSAPVVENCSQTEDPNEQGGGRTIATSLLAPSLATRRRAVHARSVRVTLTLLSLAMAYMLLAMQFGLPAMTSIAPDGGHMPGMPGM
jgi:Domain of unknown function (DUF5134)